MNWFGIAYVLTGIALFITGVSELFPIVIGRTPDSGYGLWAAVAALTISAALTGRMQYNNPSRRTASSPKPPAHWPSILTCVGVGCFAALLSWGEPLSVAVSRGLFSCFFCYCLFGRTWRISHEIEWDRSHAHYRRLSRYVVEGRAMSDTSWTMVGSTDDVEGLRSLRSRAHERFELVRFWSIESDVALHQSDAGGGLLLGHPLEVSEFSEAEALVATEAG